MPDVRSATFAELDVHTLYALLKLRVDVFVVEQACPYPELDDLDQTAWHFWLDGEGGPAAYLRVLGEPGGVARIGRVVVEPTRRGEGLGGILMDAALAAISADRTIVLDAQSYAQEFYARRGFAPTGPEFVEDGIPHVPMRRSPATAPGD